MSPDTRWFHDKRVELTDLSREDRSRLRPIVGAVIAAILIFGTLLYAVRSYAEETRRFSVEDQNGKLTIEAKACSLGGWFASWRSARWFYQGKPYEACWSVQNGVVVVIDSTGIVSAIPREAFKREEGI